VFLEEMKWPDIAGLDRSKTLVIGCIAAMEQHGLHLPLGTDTFIGREIVRRIEEAMPERVLCLPALWLGASSHHMDFPGTVSASTTTMRAVLHDVISSIHQHGFRKMVVLNSHGGNRALLATAIQDFGVEFAGMQIVGATYWDVAREGLSNLRESEFGGIGHACELETSFMLAAHPTLVDWSKAQADGRMSESEFARGEMLVPPTVAVYKTFKETTRNGAFGDPTKASAEKGEAMLSAVAARMIALCSDVLDDRL
jgi:creatinine amidohydrolase